MNLHRVFAYLISRRLPFVSIAIGAQVIGAASPVSGTVKLTVAALLQAVRIPMRRFCASRSKGKGLDSR
jgi:hypothetical protein